MSDAAEQLKKKLLDLEPVDTAMELRIKMEIPNMFDKKLTRGSRAWWIVSLIAAVLFTAYGLFVLLAADLDLFLKIVWGLYAGANVAFAIFAAYVLKSGVVKLRLLFAVIAAISPGATLLCAIMLIARAAVWPSIESLLWALFGVMCLMVALAWMLHNRIIAAELGTREQLLRMELRLLDRSGGANAAGEK